MSLAFLEARVQEGVHRVDARTCDRMDEGDHATISAGLELAVQQSFPLLQHNIIACPWKYQTRWYKLMMCCAMANPHTGTLIRQDDQDCQSPDTAVDVSLAGFSADFSKTLLFFIFLRCLFSTFFRAISDVGRHDSDRPSSALGGFRAKFKY